MSSTESKVENYLSSPIFPLVTGLLLGGFGLFAMWVAADDTLFHILALFLTVCGFSRRCLWTYGNIRGQTA